MTTTHKVDGAQLFAQTRAAAVLMDAMTAQARLIGCTIIQDEIQCTATQAEELATWWRENVDKQLKEAMRHGA